MPPRHQTLPQAQTASAREAMASFYCQLCSKGYSRHNEYEAHLSSYDHSHKVRLKEMRAMTRDPAAAARARKAEAKADGVISIQLGAGAGGSAGAGGTAGGGKKGGFKKSGFKSAFVPIDGEGAGDGAGEKERARRVEQENEVEGDDGDEVRGPKVKHTVLGGSMESDTEDEGYEMYDPWHPTD